MLHSVKADASPEEKLDFLLRREQEVQASLERTHRTLEGHPKRWAADIAAAAADLRHEHGEGLAGLRNEHLGARLGGVVLLVVGLVLATWGNLA